MTNDEINSFINSEYAMVTKKVVPIENDLTTTFATDDIESEKQHQNKLTIWSRVIRTTETVDSHDGKRYVYRLIGNVHYDTFTGNGWIPQTREKDVMVFSWSGNNIIVNGSGTALMVCDTVNFWTHAYKNTSYNSMGSRFVSEYPITGGWGVRFNLPNNSLANGYVNFKLSGEVKVAALTDFNFYHEYAHRTIVGDVSVSIGSGGSISIGTGGTDVAKSKPLGIFLPA